MARYIVAVSGGVDSVVLLDMLTKVPKHELLVAHVDHGIRHDSAEDAQFVRALAAKYGLPFHATRVELGWGASEERARQIRYEYLRNLADIYDAKIVTAHHADDIVETVAINLHRGTGWRGLSTHDSDIVRPLLGTYKAQLSEYARRNGLLWREDSTNQSDQYLRNRLRRHLTGFTVEHKQKLITLRHEQLAYKRKIEREVLRLIGDGPTYSRYFFSHIPTAVAMECVRLATKARLTRPQLQRALLAIKTTQPDKTYEAGAGVRLDFTSRNFTVTLIK
jgi:tRNA(Ile)-lysidine synthetase-like protein